MLKAFRDKDPNGNGKKDEIPLVNTGSWHTLGELFNLNFEFGWSLDSKGKIQYEYTSENYKEYLKFRKQLFDENLIDKEKRDMTANYELVAQDRAGVFEYFGTFQNTISSYSPYYNKAEQTPVFREIMPLVNKYTGKQQKFARLSTGTGEGMYILKVAKNPEVCLRIADFLWASDEYEMFRYFGIEGMSYKKEANGKFTNIVPADYKGTLTYLVSIGGGQPPFANRQSELGWRNTYPAWMFERAEQLQKYYVDPLTPFVFNSQESDEIKNYKTDVETYRDEMTANFIEGRTSLDKYDDYVKQMNKIGLTQLTSIYQKKYEQTSK
jgi:putative aldouronate transport system substrate-binding protein